MLDPHFHLLARCCVLLLAASAVSCTLPSAPESYPERILEEGLERSRAVLPYLHRDPDPPIDEKGAALDLRYARLPCAAGADRPALVMIPGVPEFLGYFDPLCFGPAGRGGLANEVPIWIVYPAGFCGSHATLRETSLAGHAEGLVAFLRSKRAELASFHLLGHSYGAEIAFRVAAAMPEKVLSLTLISSSGFPRRSQRTSPSEDAMRAWDATLLRWTYGIPLVEGFATAHVDADSVRSDLAFLRGSRRLEEDDQLVREFLVALRLRGSLGAAQDLANWELEREDDERTRLLLRRLPTRLRDRTLLLHGSADPILTASEQACEIREALDAGKVLVLDGVGHLAHEEAPEEILAAVREHLCTAEVQNHVR